MRVLVCGSRGWKDYDAILQRLRLLQEQVGEIEVVHGGANGADELAGCVSRTLRTVEHVYPALWRKHGLAAGFVRNVRMLEEMQPELVLAFWDGVSNGTRHTLDAAVERGVKVEVHLPDRKVLHAWPPSQP